MTDFKRLNYSTGQFLVAADFQREQAYHIGLRRLHNRSLHSAGVVNGLGVVYVDDSHIRIDPGLALDGDGRELMLSDAAVLDLSSQPADGTWLVTLVYQEVSEPADQATIAGVSVPTAITERAKIELVNVDPAASPDLPPGVAVLARVMRSSGRVVGVSTDATSRAWSGPIVPSVLRAESVITTGWSTIGSLQGPVWIQGNLTATGPIYATGGSLVFSQLAHPYSTQDGDAVGYATIQNCNDYQALVITGRTIRGVGDPAGPIYRVVKLWDYLEVNGTLSVVNGNQPGNLRVAGNAYFNNGINAATAYVSSNMVVNGPVTVTGGLSTTAATVSGNLNVYGTAYLRAKSGYVMDQFVNRLDEPLEIGDVVVIRASSVMIHYGNDDTIPIPEVDLTGQAYDTGVCGIVCDVHGEVAADGSTETHVYTDEEKAGRDPGRVGPGQIGHMVTMGTYAHCKVDADIAPIRAGDLLTSSPTRGHAQKVLDRSQAVGAIVGKALAGLAAGKGRIPVLVTLQ